MKPVKKALGLLVLVLLAPALLLAVWVLAVVSCICLLLLLWVAALLAAVHLLAKATYKMLCRPFKKEKE